MTLVVDSSVALKWFVAEPDSTSALALLETGEALIAPDLLIAELCNAAWRLWRRREVTREQVSIVAARTPYLFADNAPMDGLAARAAAIALNLDHPAYDCFYLALAERVDCRMVTADRRLVSRVSGTPWQSHVVGLDDFA